MEIILNNTSSNISEAWRRKSIRAKTKSDSVSKLSICLCVQIELFDLFETALVYFSLSFFSPAERCLWGFNLRRLDVIVPFYRHFQSPDDILELAILFLFKDFTNISIFPPVAYAEGFWRIFFLSADRKISQGPWLLWNFFSWLSFSSEWRHYLKFYILPFASIQDRPTFLPTFPPDTEVSPLFARPLIFRGRSKTSLDSGLLRLVFRLFYYLKKYLMR